MTVSWKQYSSIFFQSSFFLDFWVACVVSNLLKGSMCCVFRDVLLHTFVVTSHYLSYCFRPIILNQVGYSPLTSNINKAFSPRGLQLIGYFLFCSRFSPNPRDGFCGKIPVDLKCWEQPVWHQQSCTNIHISHNLSSLFWCLVWA